MPTPGKDPCPHFVRYGSKADMARNHHSLAHQDSHYVENGFVTTLLSLRATSHSSTVAAPLKGVFAWNGVTFVSFSQSPVRDR